MPAAPRGLGSRRGRGWCRDVVACLLSRRDTLGEFLEPIEDDGDLRRRLVSGLPFLSQGRAIDNRTPSLFRIPPFYVDLPVNRPGPGWRRKAG